MLLPTLAINDFKQLHNSVAGFEMNGVVVVVAKRGEREERGGG